MDQRLCGDDFTVVRPPLEVYTGIVEVQIPDGVAARLKKAFERFAAHRYAEDPLSTHLTRFVEVISTLVAYLDNRNRVSTSDVSEAIDLLDYFTSTTKWWTMTRKDPRFNLRPPSQDPRQFIRGLADLVLGKETIERSRIASDKLLAFLREQGIGKQREQTDLCSRIASCWLLLSGIICRHQARSSTEENDFELAYDIMRVLLFYTPRTEYCALRALRELGTNPILPRIAQVNLSPNFEKRLESSPAAVLDKYRSLVPARGESAPAISHGTLTNALRFMVQFQASLEGRERVEEDTYDHMIISALSMLHSVGIASEVFRDENAVSALFSRLRIIGDTLERIDNVMKRLELLLLETSGDRNFLLRYPRFVTRIMATIALIGAGTAPASSTRMEDSDLKRGIILLSRLLANRPSCPEGAPQL